jgi:hypothetical protein
VSDGFITAEHTDPNLVNAWGVAFNPFGFVWVADADAHVSTLYDGDGNANALVVQIPLPPIPPVARRPASSSMDPASSWSPRTNRPVSSSPPKKASSRPGHPRST